MTSRRAVLASLGMAGVAGLSGCSALPVGDDQDDEQEVVRLPKDTVEPIAWPESPFPVAVPAALADTHYDRARELLAAVPADLSVPNGAITEELRSNRERAAGRLEDDIDEPWPIEGLSQWRDRRSAAATVRGAYRAVTGEDDAATVTECRQAVREGRQTTIDGLRSDAYQETVTVESVTRTSERTREALAAIEESDDRRLATRLLRPAPATVHHIPAQIEEGYADPPRVQADLAWAELYAFPPRPHSWSSDSGSRSRTW